MENDQEFVEYVVKALVDKPDKVKVSRTVDEMGVLITLGVDPEDMGKVIGKEGRTAKAIRTLLRVLGAKANARVNLKIEEPEGGRMDRMEQKEDSEPDEKPAKEEKAPKAAKEEPVEDEEKTAEPVSSDEDEGQVTELV